MKNSGCTEYDYIFKFFLIGSNDIGKSCFLLRYFDDTYTDNFISTIGVDFKIKTISINESIIKVQIWDSQRRNRHSYHKIPYRGTHLVFLMYDITNLTSFKDISKYWYNEVQRYCRDDVLITIVGLKLDIVDIDNSKREVSYELAKKYAEDMNWDFYEVSSKYNYNLNSCIINSTIRTYNTFANELDLKKANTNISNTTNTTNTSNSSNSTNPSSQINKIKKDCIIN